MSQCSCSSVCVAFVLLVWGMSLFTAAFTLLTAWEIVLEKFSWKVDMLLWTFWTKLLNESRMDWHAARIALTLALLPPSPPPPFFVTFWKLRVCMYRMKRNKLLLNRLQEGQTCGRFFVFFDPGAELIRTGSSCPPPSVCGGR